MGPYSGYIFENISEDDKHMLVSLYNEYDKKLYAYKKQLKNYVIKKTLIDTSLAILTLSSIGTSVTISPFLAILSGFAVVITKISDQKLYTKKINSIKKIIKCLRGLLNEIRQLLMGETFDKNKVLDKIAYFDGVILMENIEPDVKYYKKYDTTYSEYNITK